VEESIDGASEGCDSDDEILTTSGSPAVQTIEEEETTTEEIDVLIDS
jgi:hypothetical protein